MSKTQRPSLWQSVSEFSSNWVKSVDFEKELVCSEKIPPFKAILITKGRKTGKEHAVWLRAVKYNEKIYFSRHRPDGDWFQNALAIPEVKVKIDDNVYSGRASLVKDQGLAKKISELKYPDDRRTKEKRVVIEVTLCE